MSNKVWVITGASQGLGFALVEKALSNNDCVCAVTRKKEQLIENIGEKHEKFLQLSADIKNGEEIENCKTKILNKFGRIDVLVNNAGYEQGGMLEYVTDKMVRDNFEVNVFGTFNMLQAVIPVMRKQRSGTILNITSSAAFRPLAECSTYCASKFATEGLTEALKKEMEPFGVRVCAVKPGGMNTGFLTGPNIRDVDKTNEDYEYVLRTIRKKRKYPSWEKKNANPEGVAEMLMKFVDIPELPLNLFVGSDCMIHAREQLNFLEQELDRYRTLSISTDYKEEDNE